MNNKSDDIYFSCFFSMRFLPPLISAVLISGCSKNNNESKAPAANRVTGLGDKQNDPEEVVNKEAHETGVKGKGASAKDGKEKVAGGGSESRPPLHGSDVVPAANTVATPRESKEESATAQKEEAGIEKVVNPAGSVSSGGNQGIELSQVIEIPTPELVSGGVGNSAPVATEPGVENLVNESVSAQLIQITSPSLVSGYGGSAAPPAGTRVEAASENQTQVTARELLPGLDVPGQVEPQISPESDVAEPVAPESDVPQPVEPQILPESDVAEPDLASPPVAVVSAEMFNARPRPRLGGFPEPDHDIGEVYCSRIFAGSDAAYSWLTRDSQVLNVIVLCHDTSKPYFDAAIPNTAHCLSKNSEQESAVKRIMALVCRDAQAEVPGNSIGAPVSIIDKVEQTEFKLRARSEGVLIPSRVRKEGYCPVIKGVTGNAVSWVTNPSGPLNVWITCSQGRKRWSYFAEIPGVLRCLENEAKETLRGKVESLCRDLPVREGSIAV